MINNVQELASTTLGSKKDKIFDILSIEHRDLGVAGIRHYDFKKPSGIWVLSAPNRWGKSTLIKAMKVALFGVRSFERKTPSLIYDRKDQATITLVFKDLRTSNHFKIIREIKKNELYSTLIDLATEVEIEARNDYTELEPTAVDLIMYELFGVGMFRIEDILSSYFFDVTTYMRPETMIESFSKTTNIFYELRSYLKDSINYGLDEIKEYNKREEERSSIRIRLQKLQTDIDKKTRESNKLAATLESLQTQKSEIFAKVDELKEIKTSLDPLYEKIETIARDIEVVAKQKERSETRLSELQAHRAALKKEKERLDKILINSELLHKMYQLYEERNQLSEQIGENQEIIEELKPLIMEVIGDEAPFEHAEDVLSVNKVELNARINILLEESEEHRKELEMLDMALEFIRRYQREKACPICENKDVKYNLIEKRRHDLSKRVDSIMAETERLRTRRDLRESLLKKLKDIKSAEKNLEKQKSALEKLNERIAQEKQKLDEAGLSFTQEELDASAKHIEVTARLYEIEGMLKEQERAYKEIMTKYEKEKIPEKEEQLKKLMEEYRSIKGKYEDLDIRLVKLQEELNNTEILIKNKSELLAVIQTESANLQGMHIELTNTLADLTKKEHRELEKMKTALEIANALDELFQNTIEITQQETQQRITQVVNEKSKKFELPIRSVFFAIKDGQVDDLKVERTIGPPDLTSLSLSEMVQAAYSIDSAARIFEETSCNLVILDNKGDLDAVRLDQILGDITARGIKKIILITVDTDINEKKLFQWYPLTYKFSQART